MKKPLLLLLLAVFITGNLTAQLSFEDAQILHVSFDDEADLSYTDDDFELTEEVDMEADDGIFDGGAFFDGAGSRIVYEPLEGFNHGMNWTWSFWLKTESAEDFWGIMSFGNYSGDPMTDWYDEEPCIGGIFLSSYEGVFEIEISWLGWIGPGDLEPTPWNDGEWHHVAITHSVEGENMRLYLDNVLAGEEEDPVTIAADMEEIIAENEFTVASLDDDHIKLGFAGHGWNDEEEGGQFPEIMFYEGFMDDFRLFDVALSVEEVDELYNFAPTGIGEAQSRQLMKLYPNPAREVVQIQTDGDIGDISILNIAGQEVLYFFNETRLITSTLSRGIYFLEAQIDGIPVVQKLVIE